MSCTTSGIGSPKAVLCRCWGGNPFREQSRKVRMATFTSLRCAGKGFESLCHSLHGDVRAGEFRTEETKYYPIRMISRRRFPELESTTSPTGRITSRPVRMAVRVGSAPAGRGRGLHAENPISAGIVDTCTARSIITFYQGTMFTCSATQFPANDPAECISQ